MISLDNLHYVGVGLPGQERDALGRPAPYRTSCGCLLPHGDIKASNDGMTIRRAKDQRIHCSSRRCPKCFRYNIRVDSDDFAQRLWASRNRETRRGITPAIFQLVLSPPKRHMDPLAVYRWLSKEGIEDLKKEAILIAKELGALAGSLTIHHFTENGEDGKENADITGNTLDPNDWRLALHFHAIAIFNGRVPIERVKGINQRTGWLVKVVRKKDESGRPLALGEARIKSIHQLKKKLQYLQSHASIILPDSGGRMLDSIVWFGRATHRSLREISGPSKRPLYMEGYLDTDEDGRPLYWYKDLLRFEPLGMERLAEVERINSARVYVDACDWGDCFKIICDLAQGMGIPLRYETRTDSKGNKKTVCLGPARDIPPAVLWREISQDSRFITTFEPMASAPENMRPPRKDQVDGRDLWIFREENSEIDLYEPSEEYVRFCAEADRREAELMAELSESRRRSSSGGGL